jgi:hypothetical protein
LTRHRRRNGALRFPLRRKKEPDDLDQHAWRAATLVEDRLKLCEILRIEWNGIHGWLAADANPPLP